jgi:hypothetical protein
VSARRPVEAQDDDMRSGRVAGSAGTGFRPARWAWTTITAVVLLILQGFAVVGLGVDVAESQAQRLVEARFHPTVLEAFERGFAIALVPVLLVAVVVWRLRKEGTEVDQRAAAAFGVLAVLTLVLGLVCAFLHVPESQGARLSVETALWVLGGALLVASVWTRHVPRAWWPRGKVSG